MCERADGLKPFNFKIPYVSAAWVLGAVGCSGTVGTGFGVCEGNERSVCGAFSRRGRSQ